VQLTSATRHEQGVLVCVVTDATTHEPHTHNRISHHACTPPSPHGTRRARTPTSVSQNVRANAHASSGHPIDCRRTSSAMFSRCQIDSSRRRGEDLQTRARSLRPIVSHLRALAVLREPSRGRGHLHGPSPK